jgi:hypothetical protein
MRTPWEHEEAWAIEQEKEARAHAFWQRLPDANRAKLTAYGMIPVDDILAIDEVGDSETQNEVPHAFAKFGPLQSSVRILHRPPRKSWRTSRRADPAHKIKFGMPLQKRARFAGALSASRR